MGDFSWPDDAEVAVSLSFDDGRATQLDAGVPLLAEYDALATWYVVPGNIEGRLAEWQAVEAAGHEIGNHTWSHPCTGCYRFSATRALSATPLFEVELAKVNETRLASMVPAAIISLVTQPLQARAIAAPAGAVDAA